MSSTAKWVVASEGSNLASTYLNSLANAGVATAMAYDGSLAATGDGYFYAKVSVELGSFTSTAGAYLQLNVYHSGHSGTVEDIVAGAGDIYTHLLTVGASAKKAVFYIRCYPGLMSLVFTNAGGATLASSGNAVYVTPVSEQVV